MSWRPSARALAYHGAIAGLAAALTHVCVILLIPVYASRDAFARLVPLAELQTTAALAQAGPGERLLPFLDPAVASAFCRYDLAAGPLRVRAPVGRAGFLALSFHSRRGAVFYALTDRAATRGALEALVATPEQAKILAAKDAEDEANQDLRVVSPSAEGFILVRAFSELPSLYDSALAQAKELTCETEPLP